MRCVITTPAHLDRLLDTIAAAEHRSAKQQLEYWVSQALLDAVNAQTPLEADTDEREACSVVEPARHR